MLHVRVPLYYSYYYHPRIQPELYDDFPFIVAIFHSEQTRSNIIASSKNNHPTHPTASPHDHTNYILKLNLQ